MAFNFGGTSGTSNLFGAKTTSSGPSLFGSSSGGFNFGSTAKTTAGFSFGSSAPSSTSTAGGTGFKLGATTTAASAGFGGLNTGGTGTSGFSFGSNPAPAASTGSSFNFGGTGTGFGSFGAKTTASSFNFGSAPTTTTSSFSFGNKPTQLTGGFNLGGTSSGFGLGSGGLGQQQQQQQQQQGFGIQGSLLNIATALSMPVIFGDERDVILAKWNQLQASWGTGKGCYSQSGVVDFKPENPFCRFKTVGYSMKPQARDQDGLVRLHFNKKENEVKAQQQQLVDNLFRILGNKTDLSVCVEDVKGLPNDKTEVTIYVQQRTPAGKSQRIKASDLFSYFSGGTPKTQLTQLGVVNLVPFTRLSEEDLNQYLASPPMGYDPRLWSQAKLDNPDPEKLIPVPMVGFDVLRLRLEKQNQQTKNHQGRLDLVAKDISTLQHQQSTLQAKIAEHKRKHLEMSHRVLKLIAGMEVTRKAGLAIQHDEEQIRTQLEALQSELNAPNQMKGRLNEMMSQIRLQNQLSVGREERYGIDHDLQQEIKQHLKKQQEGLSHLISTIKSDVEDLKLIEQGLIGTQQHVR
ncbi:nuclear pore complex protein Nup54-like isoform X2 [Anneissia japonica]|uniref:nuclear pore complex protein Nup54-like isoform X1 n=1 Tax=Anneissia japonica TaxID=1529436 RepID=UPI0014258650|nr:nuclear pore complex protein Nup54-like isoform X1 [Anneissia japonica]XP_033111215.1 nuclear pore complex protein Nup54-like isoform X2 [Anneissia japonica]